MTGPDELAPGLMKRAAAGDREALGALLEQHRPGLLRMARMRIDARLRARVDASDVLQDVEVEALRRFSDFVRDRPMPFRLWLRFLTRQHLSGLCRRHLGAGARDARRERCAAPSPEVSSEFFADRLEASLTSPSMAAARSEVRHRLGAAIGRLSAFDREILALRHFEGLSNHEIATELGLGESTASKRYMRALERLRQLIGDLDGG